MTDTKLLLPQEMVDPRMLVPHPRNPKLHNEEFLRASVRKGLFAPVVVNRGTLTGRPNEILSGHGTREAFMQEHPGKALQVSYVDVDDERASEILLAANPGPRDPGYDNLLLVEMLQSLEDLSATGYVADDLDGLLKDLGETITPGDPEPPSDFGEYGSDISVTYGCPSCGYEWSGKPNAANATTHSSGTG